MTVPFLRNLQKPTISQPDKTLRKSSPCYNEHNETLKRIPDDQSLFNSNRYNVLEDVLYVGKKGIL